MTSACRSRPIGFSMTYHFGSKYFIIFNALLTNFIAYFKFLVPVVFALLNSVHGGLAHITSNVFGGYCS